MNGSQNREIRSKGDTGTEQVLMKRFNLETVKDLRNYLSSRNMSPERFAKEVKLSHMTIRRWMKKPDHFEIPAKYKPIMDSYIAQLQPEGTSPAAMPSLEGLKDINLSELMESVEETGRNYKDDGSLEGQLNEKLDSERFDKVMVQYCKRLFQFAMAKDTPLKVKAICIGALLYFINPIDLIPDNIPIIGYLDDFVVLSVAINVVNGAMKEEEIHRSKVQSNG